MSTSRTFRACPLCGEPLYPWITLPPERGEATVGMPLDAEQGAERVIERCENCGVALDRDREADRAQEWAAVARLADAGAVELPNLASLQAAIGVQGWTAIEDFPGRLMLTPRALELLGERTGNAVGPVSTPACRQGQLGMWRTMLNGLTFHPNFEREVRAGRLTIATSRGRVRYLADVVVTVLGAPLVLLVSAPFELVGALLKRGGVMTADLVQGTTRGDK